MKKSFIVILSIFLNAVLCFGTEEIFLLNNNIISPEITHVQPAVKKNIQYRAATSENNSNQAISISPFYPNISTYSLDNGFSIVECGGVQYLCYIDIEQSNLVIQKIIGSNTLTEKIIVCPVKYDLSNGQSIDISGKEIYIALKEKDKLYFIKETIDENNFEKILVSENISGLSDIKMNNNQLNILSAKNGLPVFFKSVNNGKIWKEITEISNKKLRCVNNISYGIAKPQIFNAGNNKLAAVYASPELTIQTSNNNGINWSDPYIISDSSALNGFSVSGDEKNINCRWIENGVVKEKQLALESIGIIAGSGTATNLNNVVVYPNPFKQGELINGFVTFANITADVQIKIYTIAGELVDEINLANTTGSARWDCKNKKGESVASGVYLYVMKNSVGEKKTGKVVIIR